MPQFSLGDLRDLADGQMRCFPDVGEHGLMISRIDGALHAVEDNCSHADTPLSTGRLRGPYVTCPMHGARFDVRDGSHGGPPALCGIATFALDTTDESNVTVSVP